MALRTIVTPPDPVLRQRAVKVRHLTPDVVQLIEDMLETMRQAPGVGLAAPQVGVSQRVIVVEYAEPAEEGEAENPPKLFVMVNPEILRKSAEMLTGTEACPLRPRLCRYGGAARVDHRPGVERAGSTCAGESPGLAGAHLPT